jgi:hypothetical protein
MRLIFEKAGGFAGFFCAHFNCCRLLTSWPA